ncbi:MAG: hypothetical protein ABIK43_04865, partial [candidate division WOR-3 bacterium]
YLTLLHASDDPNSVSRNWRLYQTDTVETVTPQENYLLGMELNLCLLEDALRLESEICGSELIRDNRLAVHDHKSVPNWLERLLQIRLSSQFDFACRVRPVINAFDTRLYGEFRLVGPGYRSLGAPALRNDNQSCSFGLERDFFDQAVSLSASLCREHDNLINQKLSTTGFTGLMLKLELAFPGLPSANFTCSPYWQSDRATATSSHSFTASLSHSFASAAINNSPHLSVSYQNFGSSDTLLRDCSSLSLGIGNSLSFGFPLTVSADVQLQRSTISDSATSLLSLSLAPSYTLFGSWTNALSLSGSLEDNNRRLDIGLNSALPVGRICAAGIAIARSAYLGTAGGYSLWRLSGSLTRSW